MRDEGGRNGASIVGINKGTAGVLLLLKKKKSEENGGKTRKRIMLKRIKRESRTKRKG